MKTYFININDTFFCEENKSISVNLVIELCIYDLHFSTKLLGYSNDEQKNVSIKDSFYGTLDCYEALCSHYTHICNDFISYLHANITTQKQLEEFVDKLENPKFEFHYKLLNAFTQNQLEDIVKNHFDPNPILNLENFDNFLPIVTNGWWADGIEVSVDLNDSDYPLIESEDGILTPKEVLESFKI